MEDLAGAEDMEDPEMKEEEVGKKSDDKEGRNSYSGHNFVNHSKVKQCKRDSFY